MHVGYVDTAMASHSDGPETGEFEILADETSRQVEAALSGPLEALHPQLTRASDPAAG